ncbi:MAG: RNHCP domain-containing protein [Oscillospiraceae bacterium]|nr:RNHCP domain-containing protein [Oscillospiraceae bacterium]
MQKRFTMKDEGFTCAVCGENVGLLGYTARDHCPRCLSSVHLDNFPGDREADCGALLTPIGLEKGKKDWKIVYRCTGCSTVKRNKAAADDDMDLLIKLSAGSG